MRLKISESRNSKTLYVIEDVKISGKRTTQIFKRLGNYDELLIELNGRDPIEWAKEQIKELNKKNKDSKTQVIAKFSQSTQLPMNEQRSFNIGYLFLQKILSDLKVDQIFEDISKRHKYTFDLQGIFSTLVNARALFPASKLATHKSTQNFIEQPSFDLQHFYRSLNVLSDESDFIQAQLYKNSGNFAKHSKILYYDCTNFFFEIEQEDGMKKYGKSKENRPNPIVQMGMFMDGNGVPLAFDIFHGNKNEQPTLKPLEKKIIKDYDMKKVVVCTDAGLASKNNRIYNSANNRRFITTQSLKVLKKDLKEWALEPTGWKSTADNEIHNIEKLDEKNVRENTYFYKVKPIIDSDGFEQNLIVTFSLKYKYYKQKIRAKQIERAQKLIDSGAKKRKAKNSNDVRRFISEKHATTDGEMAEHVELAIDYDVISEEAKFDGFYGVCTNLEDSAPEIIKVNSRRWEIEECFRIMKAEFKSRPVFVQKDEKIEGHFLTCFVALLVFRLMEQRIGEGFTCREILTGLKDMNVMKVGTDYVPTYKRTEFTDRLHDVYGCRTDFEIISEQSMKKIINNSKKVSKIKNGTQK